MNMENIVTTSTLTFIMGFLGGFLLNTFSKYCSDYLTDKRHYKDEIKQINSRFYRFKNDFPECFSFLKESLIKNPSLRNIGLVGDKNGKSNDNFETTVDYIKRKNIFQCPIKHEEAFLFLRECNFVEIEKSDNQSESIIYRLEVRFINLVLT